MPLNAAAAGDHGPTALTIAGFDPGSGAGVTADLLTFKRFQTFGTAAITALTVQSTRGVRRVEPVDPGLLAETLAELERDLPADGIKIGMLGGAPQARVVADFLQEVRRRREVHVVLDPVLASSSGALLLSEEGRSLLTGELLPLVDAFTPNLREAEILSGLPCYTPQQIEAAAASLSSAFPNAAVVVTGGHMRPPADLVWQRDAPVWISGEWIESRATHGTGCVFSSALLASRLRCKDWLEAVREAKTFVAAAIRSAPARGTGYGPMNLLT